MTLDFLMVFYLEANPCFRLYVCSPDPEASGRDRKRYRLYQGYGIPFTKESFAINYRPDENFATPELFPKFAAFKKNNHNNSPNLKLFIACNCTTL